MRGLISDTFKPILLAGLALVMSHCNDGCIPPGGQALEQAYRAELLQCAETMPSLQASCLCRLSVDTKYGLCPAVAWPQYDRCEGRCAGTE